jgi:hypothetical protein
MNQRQRTLTILILMVCTWLIASAFVGADTLPPSTPATPAPTNGYYDANGPYWLYDATGRTWQAGAAAPAAAVAASAAAPAAAPAYSYTASAYSYNSYVAPNPYYGYYQPYSYTYYNPWFVASTAPYTADYAYGWAPYYNSAYYGYAYYGYNVYSAYLRNREKADALHARLVGRDGNVITSENMGRAWRFNTSP